MKLCKICTHENSDEALFCAHCGARLDETAQSAVNNTDNGTGDGFFDDVNTSASENQAADAGSGNGGNFGGYGNANGGYNGGYDVNNARPISPEETKITEFKGKIRALNSSTLVLLIAIAFTISTAISVIGSILNGSFGFDLFSLLITIGMWRIYNSSKKNETIVGYNLISGVTIVLAVFSFIGAFFVFIGGIFVFLGAETIVEMINLPEFEQVFIDSNMTEAYQWLVELLTFEFLTKVGIYLIALTAISIVQGLCLLHYNKLVKGFTTNFNRGINDASIYSKSQIYLGLNIAVTILSAIGSYILMPSLIIFDFFMILEIITVLSEVAALIASIILVKKLKEIE